MKRAKKQRVGAKTINTIVDSISASKVASDETARQAGIRKNLNEEANFSCQVNISSQIECQPTCQGFNGQQCENNVLQRFKSNLTSQSHPLVEIVTMGSKGKGLRAKQCIPKSTFIAEYIGKKLKGNERKIKDGRYIMLIGGLYYDAEGMTSYAQLINNGCDPNCIVEQWEVNGSTRAKVIAIRNIAKHEELTIKYNWNRKKVECFCESSRCIGYI